MMEKLRIATNTNKKIFTIEEFFLFLIFVGYVFASGIAIPLNIEESSRIFAVPFRVGVFLLSGWVIFKNYQVKKFWNYAIISFIGFWLFYFGKAYYSLNYDVYKPDFLGTTNEIYVRILLIVLFPSIACMMIDYSKINFEKLFRNIFYGFLLMLSLNLVWGIFHRIGFAIPSIFAIYYISIGHLGTSLFIISLFYLLFAKNAATPQKYIFIFGLLLGAATVVNLTARSPFLALGVVAFYLILIKRKWIFYALFVLLLAVVIGMVFYFGSHYPESKSFATRTYNWLFLGDNSLRTPLFERGFEIFIKNPIFGGRIQYEDGMYPHNIFLELLMATGIIGTILYVIRFLPVLKSLKIFLSDRFNAYYILAFALFLQYFVLVLTSYNLYSVPEFLHFSSVVVGISLSYLYEKTKSNDRRGNTTGNY